MAARSLRRLFGRLAQLLPLEEPQRLQLLQLDDVHERLDRMLGWLP